MLHELVMESIEWRRVANEITELTFLGPLVRRRRNLYSGMRCLVKDASYRISFRNRAGPQR